MTLIVSRLVNLVAIVATGTLAIAGCASVAVTNDAIEQNTASALGLKRGAFTIFDRVDDGIKSSYAVKTSCHVRQSSRRTEGVTSRCS